MKLFRLLLHLFAKQKDNETVTFIGRPDGSIEKLLLDGSLKTIRCAK